MTLNITALAGGIGGARFLRGLRQLTDHADVHITVIGNTGDDIYVHGLRVCPDLDTVMYTLGGGISAERGWGREGETFHAKEELAAYGVQPDWFGLGDRDIATHLVRTTSLNAGYSLSAVTEALCQRWQPGVRLLPMTDDRAETHVIIDDPENPQARIAIHFQEWWLRYRAQIPAHGFTIVGIENTQPAPGVIEAISQADVVILPPSNPIVSIGTILAVPGIRDAMRSTSAPVVGLSPIIGAGPVRGMADACLAALDIPTSAMGVATHYGSRNDGGILDAWLIDTADADQVPHINVRGITCTAVPLYMTTEMHTAQMAREALDLVGMTIPGR